jgi:hypothetical protein
MSGAEEVAGRCMQCLHLHNPGACEGVRGGQNGSRYENTSRAVATRNADEWKS